MGMVHGCARNPEFEDQTRVGGLILGRGETVVPKKITRPIAQEMEELVTLVANLSQWPRALIPERVQNPGGK
jgi:hypothetical protein